MLPGQCERACESAGRRGGTHLRRHGRTRRRGRGLRAGLPWCLRVRACVCVCVRACRLWAVCCQGQRSRSAGRRVRVQVQVESQATATATVSSSSRKRQVQRIDKARRQMTRPAKRRNKTKTTAAVCLEFMPDAARSPDTQGAINRAFPGPSRRRDHTSAFHSRLAPLGTHLALRECLRDGIARCPVPWLRVTIS